MAKFCKYCGKPLEEGQVCDCPASVAAAQPAPAPVAAPTPTPVDAPAPIPDQAAFNTEKAAAAAKAVGEKAKSIFGLWANSLLTYLKAPRQGVTEVLNNPKNLILAGIYAGINALAAFFFLWALMGKALGAIIGLAGGFGIKIGYPVGILLLAGILCAVVFIGMSGLALFVCAKLNKRELNIAQAMVIASVSSTFPTALLLIGTLLGLISMLLAMFCLAAAGLVWAINACTDAYDYAGLNGTRSLKEMGILLVAMLVVLLVCYFITQALLGWAIGGITVNGTKLGNIGELIGNFGNILG